jgi:hypothetical protein
VAGVQAMHGLIARVLAAELHLLRQRSRIVHRRPAGDVVQSFVPAKMKRLTHSICRSLAPDVEPPHI